MSGEGFVRPFQTRNVTPPIIVPNSGAVKTPTIVRIRAGYGTALRMTSGSQNYSVTFYTIKYPRDMTLSESLHLPIGT